MNPNTFLEGSDLYLSDPIVKSLKKKKKNWSKIAEYCPKSSKILKFLKKLFKKKLSAKIAKILIGTSLPYTY